MAAYERGSIGRHAAADLRRLRWLGFGLPILFLVGVELFRVIAIERNPERFADNVALAVIEAIAILGFAVLMFRLIERAEAQVMRQNRELTAINAVSTAVQGELGVEQIIDAALQVVLDRSGATEASVVIFGRDDARQPALERRIVRSSHVTPDDVGEAMPHLVEIPLAHGSTIVGRMRLHLAADGLEPDLPATATLNNIGHQLASSIEIGQLISDLQRREVEDRGLYDVLLLISNQKPLAETLDALARHACGLLDAEAIEIRLTPQAAVLFDGAAETTISPTRTSDGGAMIAVGRTRTDDSHTGRLTRLSLVSPEQTLGELCVYLADEHAVAEREWRFMHRSTELAVIAITSSRMRERERQVAILAERERLAREMHDSLAQVLGFIHLRLVSLRTKVTRINSPEMNCTLDELAGVAQEAYRDVREAILGLRESSRAGRSLVEYLGAYLERYEHQAGIETRLVTDFEEPPQLSPQAEIHIIRVIQESLTNIRKHSGAKHATVRVSCDDDMATFIVEDDGRGFDVSSAPFGREGGFGLVAMSERVELVGGTLAIDSEPGRGTRVIARVPVVHVAYRPAEDGHHVLA